MNQKQLYDLYARALAVINSMTPDQLLHHRHEQRISFASGNVALSSHNANVEEVRKNVRKAAGPCPCTTCRGKETNVYR